MSAGAGWPCAEMDLKAQTHSLVTNYKLSELSFYLSFFFFFFHLMATPFPFPYCPPSTPHQVVCVCVCVCVCAVFVLCVCERAHAHACMHVCICVCVCICMSVISVIVKHSRTPVCVEEGCIIQMPSTNIITLTQCEP